MYKENEITVLIPAFNEELLLPETIQSLPHFVDNIIIIEDCSTDGTKDFINGIVKTNNKIVPIFHEKNKGLGQSLIDGYLKSGDQYLGITVVMAGDNQMHPDDLPHILDKITDEGYDYVKGNRLLHQDVHKMPKYRFFGNAFLTILTKFATGYYFLMDPQCGYTAIKNSALKLIPISKMTKGYGYNADILCMLNIQKFKVSDVEVRPIYDREKSKIKLWKYIPNISLLLFRLFFRRLWKRYVVLDFHPLVLFYFFSFINFFLLIIPFSIRFFYMLNKYDELPKTTMSILVMTFLISFQSIIFAIWMDMDYNKEK